MEGINRAGSTPLHLLVQLTRASCLIQSVFWVSPRQFTLSHLFFMAFCSLWRWCYLASLDCIQLALISLANAIKPPAMALPKLAFLPLMSTGRLKRLNWKDQNREEGDTLVSPLNTAIITKFSREIAPSGESTHFLQILVRFKPTFQSFSQSQFLTDHLSLNQNPVKPKR